jgi:structural maintenance of chromosome 4
MSETILQECRKRRLDIKSEIRTITKTVRSLESSIPKLKLEVDGFESTRQQLTKVIPELQKQSFVTPDDLASIKKLEDKVRMCESDLLACSNRAERLEAEVTKLQNDILEAGGPQLKQQRATCDNILLRLKSAEKQLATSKVEIFSAEKAEAKSSSAKHDLEEKLFKCERSLSEKEVAFKSLESGALAVIAAFEQAKIVEAEKRAALEEVSTEIDQLKKSQADVRWKEVELLGQIEGIEKQISDNQKKIQQCVKEISSLQKFDQELEFEGQNVASPAPNSTAVNQDGDSPDGLGGFPHEKLQKYDPEEIKNDIANLQAERNLLSKNANMGAIAEYRKKEADYLSR